MMSRRSPNSVRICPANLSTILGVSQIKNRVSSSLSPRRSIKICCFSTERNFTMGPFSSIPDNTEIYPRPLIPIPMAKSSILSKKDLGMPAQFGATIPLTGLFLKGAKSTSIKKSVRSLITKGFRRSGLSVP